MSLEDAKKSVGRPRAPEYLPPTTLDPVLYQQLADVRRTLAKVEGFPRGWCELTSFQIESELGLPATGGHYYSPASGLTYPHHWNRTPDGKYFVDLTHDQFDSNTPAISIISAGSSVLRELPHVIKSKKRPADEG